MTTSPQDANGKKSTANGIVINVTLTILPFQTDDEQRINYN